MQIRTPETSKSEATKKTPPAGKAVKRTPVKTVSAVKTPKKVEMADKTPIKTEPVTEIFTEIEVAEKTPAEVADSKAAESSPTIAEKPVAKTQEFKAEEHASATKDIPPPMKTAVKTSSVAKSVTPKTARKIKSPSVTTTSPGNTSKMVTLGKEEEKSQTQHCEMPMALKDKQEPGNDTLMKDEEKDKVAQMDDVNKAENVRDKMEEETIEDHKGEETKAGDYGVNEEMENCGKEERFEEAGYEECRENDREADEAVGMEEEQDQMSALSNERRLKKELEIFVGGVDWDATEEDVKKPFEKVGEVVEVRLPRNNVSKKNKGFAFVKFANKEQVNRALSELKSPIIHGKQCRVAPSEDNDTLFLGNICNTWTKLAIKEKLKDYGIEGVESITLVPDPQKEGVSRGFAFVEFSCHEDAMVAYKRLQKPDVIFGHAERTAKVAFAEPLPVPDPEVMAQVKCVFVDGLPSYWDEDRVREQFKGYGEIERVTLARNMTTAKRKDFAFVNFTSHEAALACIKGLNNSELGDAGKTKTKARARLANPAPKTQAVKGGMRGGFRVAGRGFARGGRPFSGTGGFHRGRGFHPRGRGRSGRFPFPDDNDVESFQPEFRGRRPFGRRGGRRGAFGSTYEEPVEEFLDQADISSRLDMERPSHRDPFQSSRRLHSPEGDFSRSFGSQDAGGESYQYYRGGYGTKRRYSIMDHESAYMDSEPTRNRLRLQYDYSDSLSHRMRYQDTLGTSDSQYSRDYYGSDYYGSRHSSLYDDARLMGDRYYY